jgi:hypothetical protein
MKIDTERHIKQLKKIVEKHQIAGGPGIWLNLRAVRGSRKPDGSWEHEYQLEVTDPFEENVE